MESLHPDPDHLESMKAQLAALEESCITLKKKLEQLRKEAIQQKFDLNALDHPGFFQKHFGNLKAKKEAAWQAYRAALSAQDQAQMDYDEQSARCAALRAEYTALISPQNAIH